MRKLRILALLTLNSLAASSSLANVVGADAQNFNPTTSGLDFVTVQSSETLAPGVYNLGLFVNHAVNSLPRFDNSKEQSRLRVNDYVTGADFNLGLGLLPNLDAGISFPHIIYQSVRDTSSSGKFGQRGNTEIRVNAKYRLFGDSSHGMAVVGSTNFDRTTNNPYTGKNPKPIYNMELAGDLTIWRVALGANAGYRWRSPGESVDPGGPIQPLDDQIIASAAASYLFTGIDTKLILETFGSRPAKSDDEDTNRKTSTGEVLLGVKHDFTNGLAVHAGGGTELFHGRSSPDWRAYAGMNLSLGQRPEARPPVPVPAPKVAAPAPAAPTESNPFVGAPKARAKFVVQNIIFEFDSTKIVNDGAINLIANLVQYLNEKPAFSRLVIIGHTDSIGSAEYNQSLSWDRAQAIRILLVKEFGLDASKIEAFGKGASEPIDDNGNYQGRQMNRRVEFLIYRDVK